MPTYIYIYISMHACMRACMHVHKCVHLIRMVPADGSCYQEYGCFLLSMGCMVSYSELSASIHACMCISACTSCIRTCKCNFFTMVPAIYRLWVPADVPAIYGLWVHSGIRMLPAIYALVSYSDSKIIAL